jgi:hypothetical protein
MPLQAQIKRDWSFRDLFQSGVRLNPKTRKKPSKSPNIRLKKIVPFAGVNSALFQMEMDGVTQYPVRHKVNIFVSGIETTQEEQSNRNKYFQYSDGKNDYWIEKPSTKDPKVTVRCTCKDYYFTWGWWNFKQGAMFGRQQKPYVRKTPPPPDGYPYRNPNKYAGSCKHVTNSIKWLIFNDFWKDGAEIPRSETPQRQRRARRTGRGRQRDRFTSGTGIGSSGRGGILG